MIEILRTHSVSYAQSVRLALEAQGIQAVLLDEQAPMYLSFAGRVRLAVAHEADYERAMEVVRSFEASASPSEVPASWQWQRWGCAGMVGGVGVLGLAGAAAEHLSRALAYGLFAMAIGLLIAGITLIVAGPRRDRQKPS